MTDTSLPTEAEAAPPAADAPAEAAPAEEAAPDEATELASQPVTEHPAHDLAGDILDSIGVERTENALRSVFEVIERHARGTTAEEVPS